MPQANVKHWRRLDNAAKLFRRRAVKGIPVYFGSTVN